MIAWLNINVHFGELPTLERHPFKEAVCFGKKFHFRELHMLENFNKKFQFCLIVKHVQSAGR